MKRILPWLVPIAILLAWQAGSDVRPHPGERAAGTVRCR